MLASLTLALVMQQSDLKIEDTKPGTGDAIKQYDYVEVQYTGTLLNGKVFDSNMKPGAPPFRFQIGVGQVIKGWDFGFMGMKVGGERNLTIPPALAYGDRAMGDDIPANSTLKFSVKLLRIVPAAKVTVMTEGKGDAIRLDQLLDCKLSIKLPGGKEIADPTKISRLQLGRRMRPWINQSVAGIKEGEKRKVIVNFEMAYGEKGDPPVDKDGVKAGSRVPPKADLTIEIEAVKIVG